MPSDPHIWLVTFAHGAQFLAGQKGLVRSALEVGRIDRAVSWTRKELVKTEFYRANKALLDRRRGVGYWAWKPFIILDQLQRAADGEFVVYHDAGPRTLYRFRRSVRPLLQWCGDRRSGMLPGIYYRGANKRWTKRDCFVYMDCDQPRYWQHRQVQSGFCVWQRHARSLRFVAEWLRWCTDPRVITDDPNQCGLPNLPGCTAHRHDQSILTNLAVRDGLKGVLLPPPAPPPAGRISAFNIDQLLQRAHDGHLG